MQIAILGAGGVGGYFGGRITEAGGEVTFITRPATAERLRTHGLSIRSPLGDWHGRVRAVTADDCDACPDVLVLACKSFQLADALTTIRPVISPHTRLLPFLNGVRQMDRLSHAFPEQPLLGGYADLMVSALRPGTVVHGNRVHRFRFGTLDGAADPVLDQLDAAVNAANMDACSTPAIGQEMWVKYLMISAFSAVSSLARAPVGDIVAADNGARLMRRALAESEAIARAEGFPPSEAQRDRVERLLTEPGSPFTASMMRDLTAGRRTEAAHILGDMATRARRHDIDAPIIETAWMTFQIHERRLLAEGHAGAPPSQPTPTDPRYRTRAGISRP